MPPATPAKKRAAILKDIKTGKKSQHQISRDHNVSRATINRIAHDAGITDAFDRSKTENATRARVADNKERRAALVAGLLEDAEHLRERARQPYPVVVSGREGAEIVTLPEPPLRDVQAAFTAAAIALDKSIAVERHDIDKSATDGATVIIDLGAQIRALAAAQAPPSDAVV